MKDGGGRLWCGMRRFWYDRGTGWSCERAMGYFGGNWGVLLLLLLKVFQGLQQLVQGLWVDYLMDGSSIQNTY
jgi:hypothetical protein